MADEFAVLVVDAPLSTGVVNYTSPKITDFQAAVVFVSGDYLTEASSAQLSLAYFSKQGPSTKAGGLSSFFRAGQSGASVARHAASTSSAGTGLIRVLDPATLGGDWALGTVSDLSDGIAVNWTDVSGLSSSRKVKLIVILFGGCGVRAGSAAQNASFYVGGSPTHLLSFAKRGSFGGIATGFSVTVGGAVDGGSIVQGFAGTCWPTAADPVSCGQYLSTTNYAGAIQEAGGVPTTVSDDAVTDFVTDGFDRDGTAVGAFWLGFNWVDDRVGLIAVETFTGSESGVTALVGLGRYCEVVIGVWIGATSSDALQTGAPAQQLGVFVTDGVETHSISCAIDEGLDPDSMPTVAYSRYKSGEWNVVSGAGGTAFRATSVAITPTGLSIDVATSQAGRLFLWGVSRIPALEPAAATLDLGLPAPSLLAENRVFPTPVPIPLSVPVPTIMAPHQPNAVPIALVLPAPAVFTPAIPVIVEEPDLGPAYHESLAALLPRGLAWPKRSSP